MKTLWFVFAYAKNYIKPLIIAVVSMICLVAVQLVAPWVIRSLISAVQAQVLDANSIRQVTNLALLSLAIYVVRAGLRFLSSYMSHVAGWGVVAEVRKGIYRHLQQLSLRFYEDSQTGQLMSRMVNDSDYFERLISHAVPDTLVNVLTLFGVGAILFSMNWRLMLLTMIPIPFIILAMRGFAKYVRPAFRRRQQQLGDLNAAINDNLSGIREIKAFTREHLEEQRIGTTINDYRETLLNALRLMATFHPFVELASSMGTIVIIYFGGRLALGQVLPLADLVAFLLYIDLFYQPVRTLSNAWEAIQESLAGADRVSELLNEKIDVDDRPDAITLKQRAQGHLEFRDVDFYYNKGTVVLEGINLDVEPNKVVALVGPTGVGKTTLVSLIPRFYDVIGGGILLDGRDIRDITLKSLRSQISMVLQDVFLFNGSVRDNIRFGKPQATEQEIVEAAQIANAHDFILKLSEGYETIIGERGVKLSGGQKQRLSIARAVLKDAPILILDEATSSVDTETEMLIQQALERLILNRTTIIIAHRLSTIRNADLIVVLEGNRISEMGSHNELMAKDGLYRHLSTVQNQMSPELLMSLTR